MQKQKIGKSQELLIATMKTVLSEKMNLSPLIVDLMLSYPQQLLWDSLIEVFQYYYNGLNLAHLIVNCHKSLTDPTP
jgi:hypothetical protein